MDNEDKMTVRADWADGEILYSDDLNDTFNNVADAVDTLYGTIGNNSSLSFPIGSVVAWLKTYTNTPALTGGWVQADGQTVSDAQSPYNGVTLPNLNSTNRFLRGNTTSGSTGGSTTHTHTVGDGGQGNNNGTSGDGIVKNQTTDPASGIPPYYNVVWIIRIK